MKITATYQITPEVISAVRKHLKFCEPTKDFTDDEISNMLKFTLKENGSFEVFTKL